MNKYALSILFAVMLLFGCNKEPINTEEDITNVLDGWQIFKTKYDFENPRDLYFVNESVGFVVGYNGKIYKTTNGGAIWRELDSGTRSHLRSVYFINEKEGFVSSGRNSHGSELLKTNDGGETWTKTSFPEYNIIWSMKFFDAMNGIALVEVPTITDSRSYVAITSDGGESWNLIYSLSTISYMLLVQTKEFLKVRTMVIVGKQSIHLSKPITMLEIFFSTMKTSDTSTV